MALQDKYINPFTDFGFKKLFGTELNKDLLIDFLNTVILPEKRKIKDLTYKPTEQFGITESDRKSIFDIYCVGTNNERFVVEMQKAKQNYFKDRSVYYSSFPIQEQAIRGEWNFKLSEVFMVGILDFVFSDNKEESVVRHVVKLKNEKCQVFFDKLTFIYLEMPHFTKKESELESNYDKWLFALKNLPDLQNRPLALQEKIWKRLFEAAEIAKFNAVERNEYEGSLKVYRDLKNVIDTAFDDGKMEEKMDGIQKALKRGKLTIEEIAEDFDVTVDFVMQIKMGAGL